MLALTATHTLDLPPNRKCHQLTKTYTEIKLAAKGCFDLMWFVCDSQES